MPNAAAASFDEDYGYDEPARRKAPRKPRAAPGRKKKGGWSFDMGRVARYAAIGMSATIALGIMYNALMSQKGHHPAPLFAKPAPVVQARPPIEARPVAPRAPAMPEPADETEEAPMPVAKPPRHAVAPQHAAADHGDDAIARLLQTGAATTASGDKTDTKTVLAAQKALTKLGFAVKASGAMGPATRKAIERFEQDRHMAVKGELTRRVVKVLSAESGIKID